MVASGQEVASEPVDHFCVFFLGASHEPGALMDCKRYVRMGAFFQIIQFTNDGVEVEVGLMVISILVLMEEFACLGWLVFCHCVQLIQLKVL